MPTEPKRSADQPTASEEKFSLIRALGVDECKFGELKSESDKLRKVKNLPPFSDSELLDIFVSNTNPRKVAPLAVEEAHVMAVVTGHIKKSKCGPSK